MCEAWSGRNPNVRPTDDLNWIEPFSSLNAIRASTQSNENRAVKPDLSIRAQDNYIVHSHRHFAAVLYSKRINDCAT